MPIPLGMNGLPGARNTIRPTAGHQPVRAAPMVAIGLFIGAVVLLGLIAFFQGA